MFSKFQNRRPFRSPKSEGHSRLKSMLEFFFVRTTTHRQHQVLDYIWGIYTCYMVIRTCRDIAISW